jgi:glycosyltransferase involved in cell wall biosynthesis
MATHQPSRDTPPKLDVEGAKGSGLSFSVVIPVKDARPYLDELIEALQRLEQPAGGYEVLFVDDGSTDGTFERLQEAARSDERFRVLTGPQSGPAGARNVGIAAAKGDFVAFTDGDTIPEADWLTAAENVISTSHVRAVEGTMLPWSQSQPNYPYRMTVNLDGGRYMTGNMVYQRQLLDELGGFDTNFRSPHFLEDSDLAFRAMDRGTEIPYSPAVRIRHRLETYGPMRFLRDQTKLQWIPLVAQKHPKRYRAQLVPKVQRLRPGDVDLLVALPLFTIALLTPASWVLKALAAIALAISVRRVASGIPLNGLNLRQKTAWFLALLVAPYIRVLSLGRGWLRARKVVL